MCLGKVDRWPGFKSDESKGEQAGNSVVFIGFHWFSLVFKLVFDQTYPKMRLGRCRQACEAAREHVMSQVAVGRRASHAELQSQSSKGLHATPRPYFCPNAFETVLNQLSNGLRHATFCAQDAK